ncbi:MAG: glutamine synthetase III [Oscillospiraceae bacterium]|nr:glutamine synthetase III [Oscillospiraceae bacterium]
MEKVTDYFGSMVFDERVMKAMLSEKVYKSLKRTIDKGQPLDTDVADAVAAAMKDWAVEKGATHYTHWFQPMTGVTAEKHDSFISPAPDGRVIMEFSGKELIKGEPDASSFPSGGLRATFEARGYTAWDPTSFAFIKDGTLYIPTAFCSYGGEALDKKVPLLRSMDALNVQAMRILKLFGTDASCVKTSVGPEQEYFLIPKELYDRREDLIMTGRTLFGAPAPKGQEMEDHYFGSIKPRVAEYMADLDKELWKLGVLAKTKHNEVAPSQHELAPIYRTTNIAADNNQLMMEVMKKVAARHGLVCLLHEKPFKGVNGSGKHNNWSISTDKGENLLSPGKEPHDNVRFLLFLVAVIKAVDEYQDLLRLSVATAGNDHRLGANEAPPAVISVFLGDELTAVLDSIENDAPYDGQKRTMMDLGARVLPSLRKDTTDRNRTSPFAFTGNKFEFRALGSSNSISCANIHLNAAVAESLRQFADVLEKADDFDHAVHHLIRETIKAHKRIIFNGNGYDDAWIAEAERRGLSNYKTTPDCMPHICDKKNVEMLTRHSIFTEAEIYSRRDIMLENYVKTVNIEAVTMIDMARTQILPAVSAYAAKQAEGVVSVRKAVPDARCGYEVKIVEKLSMLTDQMEVDLAALEKAVSDMHSITDVVAQSESVRDNVIPCMERLREATDAAEVMVAKESWPFPTYDKLLFGV